MTCRHTTSKVIGTREEGHRNAKATTFRYIKGRRRECLECGKRFNTFELSCKQLEYFMNLLSKIKHRLGASRMTKTHIVIIAVLEEEITNLKLRLAKLEGPDE